ncbi:hypothetical protein RIF29_26368 [Crotalaria pallida]|uniref:Uncharacterized protein n=1 Tax=Crotalaria pallida TaxID=3830 RepID=A0AAN9EPW2_CROPI
MCFTYELRTGTYPIIRGSFANWYRWVRTSIPRKQQIGIQNQIFNRKEGKTKNEKERRKKKNRTNSERLRHFASDLRSKIPSHPTSNTCNPISSIPVFHGPPELPRANGTSEL